ncbi:MAG: DUF3782 domain-containing protein [Bacteroidota bacterium]|nr:DUF3782 domain-containing protein [Bacteroidota bacterium]
MSDLTYDGVLELFVQSDKRFEQKMDRITSDFNKLNKELSRKISDLGDTLGRFAEEQVRADLINKFDNWGIPVHAITNHYVQKDLQNEFIYEVDILIYNSQFAIAIEVKNTLRAEHIDEHLKRIEKIQKHPMVGLEGKTLLGGVAGMIVGEGVDKYAEKNGLFVLKPSGDTVKIINDKKTFKPKKWRVG